MKKYLGVLRPRSGKEFEITQTRAGLFFSGDIVGRMRRDPHNALDAVGLAHSYQVSPTLNSPVLFIGDQVQAAVMPCRDPRA